MEQKQTNFAVGQKVIMTNKSNLDQKGTILYIGQLEGKDGTFYGIELENPNGKHDGEFSGKRYFTCKMGHGIFAKTNQFKLQEGQSKPVAPPKESPVSSSQNLQTKKASTTTTVPKTKMPLTKPTGTSGLTKKLPSSTAAQKKTADSTTTAQPVKRVATSTSQNTVVLQQKIQDLEQQLQLKTAEVSQKQVTIQKQEEKISQIAQIQTELEMQIEKNDKMETEIDKYKEDVIQKDLEIQELKENSSNIQINSEDSEVQKLSKFVQIQKEMEIKNQEYMKLKEEFNKFKLESTKSQNQQKSEIESLTTMIFQKNDDIKKLETQVEQINSQQKSDQNQQNQKISEEFEMKVEKIQLELSKQQTENKKLQQTIEEQLEQIELTTLELDDANLQKDEIQSKCEEQIKQLQTQLEQAQEQISDLKISIEQNQKFLEEGIQDQDDTQDQSADQLKQTNIKLKQALNIMHQKAEEESIKFEEKDLELEEALTNIQFEQEKYQQLLLKLKSTETNVESLEQTNEELQLQIDENQEIMEMFEKLSEEKLELEEQISAMGREMKELREQSRIDQEMIEIQNDSEKELNNIINGKDYDIYQLNEKIKSLNEQIFDKEEQIVKYKEQSNLTRKQFELLQQELDSTLDNNGVNENLKKQQQLLVDYQNLLEDSRQIYKQYIQSQVESIQYQVQDKIKVQTIQTAIPQNIKAKLNEQNIDYFCTIKKTKQNSILLLKELQNYLSNDKIVKEEFLQLSTWIYTLLEYLTNFIVQSYSYEQQLFQANTQQDFDKILEKPQKNLVIQAESIINSIIRNLMDDTLSASFSLEQFQKIVQQMQENEQNLDANTEWQKSNLLKSLNIQNVFLKKFFDLKYLKQEHNIDPLFLTLQKRLKEFSDNVIEGVKKPVESTDQVITYNFDEIAKSFNFMTEQNLIQFYQSSSNQTETLQTQNSEEEEGENDQQLLNVQSVQQTQVSSSVLLQIEDFRNSCIQVTNTINVLNTQNQQKLVLENNEQKPKLFIQQAEDINKEILNVEGIIQNEKKLDEQVQQLQANKRVLEKDLSNYKNINETLEQRVVKLELRVERIGLLEQDLQSHQQKEKHFKKAGETLRADLERYKNKLEEANQKLKTLEAQNKENNASNNNSNTPQNRISSQLNQNRQQNVIGQNMVNDLVKYFRYENCQLRSTQMKSKIQGLHQNSPMLQQFRKYKGLDVKQQKDEKENLLLNSLTQISQINEKALKNMVDFQIVDLSTLKTEQPKDKEQCIDDQISKFYNNSEVNSLRLQAYDACNKVLSKVNKTSEFKVKSSCSNENKENQSSQMIKLASINLNPGQNALNQRVNLIESEWKYVKEVF